MALSGQFRYTVMTDKLSAAIGIAQRLYSLAQEQNDAELMLGADGALASTFYFLGEFETAQQYARHGVRLWRSGVQSPAEEYLAPIASCLNYGAMCEWHFGETACCHAMMYEGSAIAKELKDTNALAQTPCCAAAIAYFERDPAEADRFASEVIELSTRHRFAFWLALGAIYRGWARSASGNSEEGIPWIEQGIRDFRAMGPVLGLPGHLARKAEALYLAHRTPEALEAINEAEALAERFEQHYFSDELHRLRGIFLAALGGDEIQIEASFCEAIRIAKEQKAISFQKRAEATYAEYRRQKASGSGGRGFRLPL
jgi:tetratricopeptide (TPR) repeat protein